MISAAIDELLRRGLADWISVWDVQDVARNIAGATTEEQERTIVLEIIGHAIQQGVVEVGDVPDNVFESWGLSAEEATARIDAIWRRFADPRLMMHQWWLNNTPLGTERAKALMAESKPRAP